MRAMCVVLRAKSVACSYEWGLKQAIGAYKIKLQTQFWNRERLQE